MSVDGPRRSDSLHLGETYDARKEKLDPAGKASTDGNGLVYGQPQTDHHVVRADGAPSVTLVGVEDGRVAYEVGSGRYRFRLEARRAH